MKLNTKLIFPFIILLFVTSINAQSIVKSELLKHYTVFEVSKFRKGAKTAVDAYKIWYKTLDINKELDTASGLLLIPSRHDDPIASVLYQHGTTDGPQDCPSNLKGIKLAMNFAAEGFLCSAADYLGMGEARGFHPYLHAKSQASAAIDMFYAAKEFCVENDILLNDSRFVSGYSQGGHAAMALYKMLEENPIYGIPIDATAAMSGPYSMSEVGVNELILKEENYFSLGFLPYLILGYQEAYGNLYDSLEEIFLPVYISPIKSFRDNKSSLTTLSVSLWATMSRSIGNTFPKNLFTPEVLEILETRDTSSPIFRALLANDLHNWKPEKPLRMYYCEGDKTVTHKNSLAADSIMNALGAFDTKAISANLTASHSTCANFTIDLAIEFFKSINLITNTTQNEPFNYRYSLVNNIGLDEITIKRDLDDSYSSNAIMIIYNLSGFPLYKENVTVKEDEMVINISNLVPGNYVLEIIDSNVARTFKFVKM